MKDLKIFGIEHIDPKAIHQMHNAMEQPFAVKGALMADAHLGYALPIGGVVATYEEVVPAWVGYDIGCGVLTCMTDFELYELRANAQDVFHALYEKIPVGFKHHKQPQVLGRIGNLPRTPWLNTMFSEGGAKQLGTLGGGNHFIEIGYDALYRVWITIHSGSRNVGHKTASHYMKLASNSNKAKEGHYPLNVNDQVGRDYIVDMNFCMEFALENRMKMLFKVEQLINAWGASGELILDTLINKNHNTCEFDQSMRLWVHRKGATPARLDEPGIIPGNMKDGCAIVIGKGNPDSLFSSSHGAGRVMSRKQAKENVDMAEFEARMVGIQAKVDEGTMDESPMAYKDFMDVLYAQEDLLEVERHLYPLINIKG